MKHPIPLLVIAGAWGLLGQGCAQNQKGADSSTPTPALAVPVGGDSAFVSYDGVIHNLHRLTEDLYSGAVPKGEAAYDELASLGIRTVISVDGGAPDKALADRYGIRVVHLPIGYDGVSDERAAALSHAMATMPRPIFVNCHHGKHRGPAGLCVGAIGSGDITPQQAVAYLDMAGTSPKYKGLWRAAETMGVEPDSVLYDPSIELPERAQTGNFVDTMNALDGLNELLQDCADNRFNAPEDHPDLAPISLAGQIHNLLRSLEEDKHTLDAGPGFLAMMEASSAHALRVEQRLEADDLAGALGALDALTDSCNECHTKYRNNI